MTTKTSEAPEAPGDASPPRPRTIPAATPRQCEFGADLGIDVDGLDLVAAGERIEIARTDRLAESRRARRKMHEHEPCPTIDGMRCYRCHERITRRGGWCPVPAPPEEHEDHENRAGYGRTPAGCPETAAHYRLVELEEAQEAEPANHPPDGLSPAESSRRSRPIHPPDGAGASLAQATGDEHPPHAAEPEPEPDPNEPKPIDMARLRRVYEEATGRRPRKQRPRRR